MVDTFNPGANINCTSSRATTDLNFFLVPSQILFEMIDIILDTLQRGDPEEIEHLQSHTSHLFPGDIQTVTPEQMASSICRRFLDMDPDKILLLFLHVDVMKSCKKLHPTL